MSASFPWLDINPNPKNAPKGDFYTAKVWSRKSLDLVFWQEPGIKTPPGSL